MSFHSPPVQCLTAGCPCTLQGQYLSGQLLKGRSPPTGLLAQRSGACSSPLRADSVCPVPRPLEMRSWNLAEPPCKELPGRPFPGGIIHHPYRSTVDPAAEHPCSVSGRFIFPTNTALHPQPSSRSSNPLIQLALSANSLDSLLVHPMHRGRSVHACSESLHSLNGGSSTT